MMTYFLLSNATNLKGLYLALFGIVFLLLILLVVLTLMKKKYFLAILLSGFFVLVTAMGVASILTVDNLDTTAAVVENPVREESVGENSSYSNEAVESNNEEESLSNDESRGRIIEYKPIESKYPKIRTYERNGEQKDYQDADGTIYKHMTMINPDGVLMGFRGIGEGIVASPISNPNNDEFVYLEGYHYFMGSYTQVVSEVVYQFNPEDVRAPYLKDFTTTKSEEYSDLDMTLYDFVYKFMPLQSPDSSQIVEVPLLEGDWVAYEDSIINGQETLAKLNFSEDGFFSMENNIVDINEIPDSMQYRLEYLDDNAIKLYLYPVTGIKTDGSFTVAEEPVKRNFILYITSEDSFELVYYSQALERVSITMNKM